MAFGRLPTIKVQKTVAVYARVSTKDKGQDVTTQLMPLRDYAASRLWKIHKEYIDIGVSGSKERRPALDEMMADARCRRFEAVVVARFDRFARSTSHLLRALEEFRVLAIDFISLSENVDTSTPTGKLVFVVLGAVSELERELIRERVQAGVDRAKRQGKRLGRPPKCMYDKEHVVDLVQSGRSITSVAKECGISRPTVDKVIADFRKNHAETPDIEPATIPIAEHHLTD